jgi:hypothetical protein
MLPVNIGNDAIRIGDRFAVSFYRTLRVPDDGKPYPLPPGLGAFPLFRVEDYHDRLPPEIRDRGGAFIPVYQREALWLGFHAAPWKPNAVLVAAGGINTVSGKADRSELSDDPQNYLVCPDQPWLDGIHTDHVAVRQFVAMPLGLGYSVEASLTGAESIGGIQVTVFEPKPGRFPESPPPRPDNGPMRLEGLGGGGRMGLGAGGAIRQKLYPDAYGRDTWDPTNSGQVFVHLVNSTQFREITGMEPPPTPVDAKAYTDHGLPWFDLYDEAQGDISPADEFSTVKTIATRDAERGEVAQGSQSFCVPTSQIRTFKPGAPDSTGSAGKKRREP